MLRSNINQQNWYRWSVAFPIPSHRLDIYSVQLRPNRLRLRWRQSTTYTYQLQTDITRMRSAQAYQPQVQPKAQTRRFATLTLVNFAQQSSEAIRISRRWIRNHTNAFPAFLLASSILPLNCNATGNANIGVCTLTTTPHASRAHTIQVHLHPAHHLVVGTGNIRRSAHRFVGARFATAYPVLRRVHRDWCWTLNDHQKPAPAASRARGDCMGLLENFRFRFGLTKSGHRNPTTARLENRFWLVGAILHRRYSRSRAIKGQHWIQHAEGRNYFVEKRQANDASPRTRSTVPWTVQVVSEE